MKNLIHAAAITLLAMSTSAHAQQAVQWKVSDGGNGHWYQLRKRLSVVSWSNAHSESVAVGGHLASVLSLQEDLFVFSVANQPGAWRGYLGPWLGGMQVPGTGEPMGTWVWSSGEPWGYVGPDSTFPNNGGPAGTDENRLHYIDSTRKWNDLPEDGDPTNGGGVRAFVVEWSADCNADGIVDYGQCLDGTLPDYDGDNTPDCCEAGMPCVVGNYPVQWRLEDGGNGHWYQSHQGIGLAFAQATAIAVGAGGHIVTPKTPDELEFVYLRFASRQSLWWSPAGSSPRHGPWIGLIQDPMSQDYSEPSGGWRWIDGSVATFLNWEFDPCNPQPADCFCGTSTCGLNNAAFYTGGVGDSVTGMGWGAFAADMAGAIGGLIIEWSADCNNDGIVDYGQILTGQLGDANTNGVPDSCEVDPCPGDITNGGTVDATDLSIVLAAWGTNGQGEFQADIDGSGLVDGGDLALVLSGWGPCP